MSLRKVLPVVFLAWVLSGVLAQGAARLPGVEVRELDEKGAYYFLLENVHKVVVLGLPPAVLGETLTNKEVMLVLGTEPTPPWARKAKVIRLGGGPMGGFLLLADGRYMLGQKPGKKEVYVLVNSPAVVSVVQGYILVGVGDGGR